jgi:hypothetical protein
MVVGTATHPLPQNPALDQVNRQIGFTTASINDPSKARASLYQYHIPANTSISQTSSAMSL